MTQKKKTDEKADPAKPGDAQAGQAPPQEGTITEQESKGQPPVQEETDLSDVQYHDQPYEGESPVAQAERIQRESNLQHKKYTGPPVDDGSFNADGPPAPEDEPTE